MKKEPLKDKKSYTQGDLYAKPQKPPLDRIEIEVFMTCNIKSAVEWLKERILDLPDDDRIGYTTGQKWVLDLINKAFQDVTKADEVK